MFKANNIQRVMDVIIYCMSVCQVLLMSLTSLTQEILISSAYTPALGFVHATCHHIYFIDVEQDIDCKIP